jgi:hypothetical protein
MEYEDLDDTLREVVDNLRDVSGRYKLKIIYNKLYRRGLSYLYTIAFPDNKNNSKKNKLEIIEMAKRGEGRPHWKKHKLGGALSNYIKEKGSSFDLEFTNVIKELRPDWFEDTAKTNKDLIIEIAKRGEGRPHHRNHKLGGVLSSYIMKSQGSYDSEFTDKLKELRPGWFEDEMEKRKKVSFEKMREVMPDFVKFKEGQEWKGTNVKYSFICEKYGEFESIPSCLMGRSWKKGKSGHPFNGGVKRQIKCSNGSIYNSATEAALILNLNRSEVSAICRGEKKQTRGFTFFYCDEEGNKVE